jgi:deazaflavin-dependent oxidoreductase (nitroreductase family)
MTDHRASDTPPASVEPKRVPVPRWVVRSIWALERVGYSASGGRFGLRTPTAQHYGKLRLRTTGRRTGEERKAIVAYLEDGPDLLLMAMNGWAEAAPAWWLNLQAHPEASVDLPGGSRTISARVADEEERPHLWAKWAALTGGGMGADLDAYAAGISHETPLVILEPRLA